jgi:hypothetical protein
MSTDALSFLGLAFAVTLIALAWALNRIVDRLEKLEQHGDSCQAPTGWTFNPPLNAGNATMIWRKERADD